MTRLEESIARLDDFFQEKQIPCAIIGGVAVNIIWIAKNDERY